MESVPPPYACVAEKYIYKKKFKNHISGITHTHTHVFVVGLTNICIIVEDREKY